jgi:hypothetical protein
LEKQQRAFTRHFSGKALLAVARDCDRYAVLYWLTLFDTRDFRLSAPGSRRLVVSAVSYQLYQPSKSDSQMTALATRIFSRHPSHQSHDLLL